MNAFRVEPRSHIEVITCALAWVSGGLVLPVAVALVIWWRHS